MNLLLDTNVLLWAALDEGRLSAQAVAALSSPEHRRYLSPVVPWELSIKAGQGKWEPPAGGLDSMLRELLDDLFLDELPILRSHALATGQLPPIHRDPFDRMLIAQARVEDMTVVTADDRFVEYGVSVIW